MRAISGKSAAVKRRARDMFKEEAAIRGLSFNASRKHAMARSMSPTSM